MSASEPDLAAERANSVLHSALAWILKEELALFELA
jgi:hypothetical protein